MNFRVFFILTLWIVSVIGTIIQKEHEVNTTTLEPNQLESPSKDSVPPTETLSKTPQQSELLSENSPPPADPQEERSSEPEESDISPISVMVYPLPQKGHLIDSDATPSVLEEDQSGQKSSSSSQPQQQSETPAGESENSHLSSETTVPDNIQSNEIFDALYILRNADGFRIMEYEDIAQEPYHFSVIVACPVDENFEDNSAGPLPDKTLYKRKIFKQSAHVDLFKCTQQYEPSLIYNGDDMFDLGYLVYYSTYYSLESDIPRNLPRAIGRELVTKQFVDHFLGRKSKKTHPTAITDDYIFWISALPFKYDILGRRLHYVKQTFYHYKTPDEKMKPCNDFKLGKEILRETEITELYSEKNQKSLFQDYQFTEDNQTPNYLINQPLAPTDDYQELGIRLATCTHLTKAPMWETIVNGWWKRINDFITKTAEHLYKLQVITGTHGVLHLPLKNSLMKAAFLQDNLHPVPEIFWKFLKYSLFSYNHTTSFNYFIIIVTHNFPNGNVPFQMICPKDVCRLNGWPLSNEDFKTGRTYCCRVTKQLLQKLGIPGNHQGVDFNLKAVDIEMNNKSEIIRSNNFTETDFNGDHQKGNSLNEQFVKIQTESETDGTASEDGDTSDHGNIGEEENPASSNDNRNKEEIKSSEMAQETN